MKELSLVIGLGILLIIACRPTAMQTPILETQPTYQVAPVPTKTVLPIGPPPTLESISEGWSTLYNPRFGFSFQYPAVYNKGFQGFEMDCRLFVQDDESKLHILIGEIQVFGEETEQNLDEFAGEYIENNRQGWQVKQNEINVNGVVAKRLDYLRTSGRGGWGVVTIFVVEHSGVTVQWFETNFTNCGLADDGYSAYWVYKRIIDSWKFN